MKIHHNSFESKLRILIYSRTIHFISRYTFIKCMYHYGSQIYDSTIDSTWTNSIKAACTFINLCSSVTICCYNSVWFQLNPMEETLPFWYMCGILLLIWVAIEYWNVRFQSVYLNSNYLDPTSSLRGNFTPSWKLACFVFYLKISNTFLENNICIL